MAEKILNTANGNVIESGRCEYVALHELGHLWDDLTSFSNLTVFQKAYIRDVGKLSPTQLDYYEYFIGEDGQGKLFAELFASTFGFGLYQNAASHFPESFALVSKVRH